MSDSTSALNRIKRRIRELAREYRDSGYRVVVEPTGAELPEFLMGFQPDLIAFGEVESVVVEVKAGAELSSSGELSALAARVEREPNWRLDMVVTNPRDQKRLEDAQPWEVSEISRLLAEARVVSDGGHKEAAFLLLWAATEALLRHIAQQEGINISELQQPRILINHLTSAGLIDRTDYGQLIAAAEIRNRVVHGVGRSAIDSRMVETLADICSRLLADLDRLVLPAEAPKQAVISDDAQNLSI
jgi:uncharacterized protein YutE (UPF0331/DUF86 family)